ncbi:MAG: hypothetical protein QNJ64_10370 [Crocosphaera sp.]|nr:hypothetical protein [Crocosphaera sp.]
MAQQIWVRMFIKFAPNRNFIGVGWLRMGGKWIFDSIRDNRGYTRYRPLDITMVG